ncbi:MAG: Rieske (2Fe-2S) protein [Lautropia sp.]|nr:Rieske (2Fe-2S) protein [Lautropia sp.]
MPLIDVAAAAEPKAMRPQAGDVLTYAIGDRKGEIIRVADLELGGPQQLAWAMDPQTKTVRDASRLNQVLLIRLKHEELSPETRTDSADGVVAYSSVCTHQGCDVSQWKAENEMLLCVCHGSEFDPKDKAAVTFGPAPRRLPTLPVKLVEGQLQVAGGFRGKPGFKDM